MILALLAFALVGSLSGNMRAAFHTGLLASVAAPALFTYLISRPHPRQQPQALTAANQQSVETAAKILVDTWPNNKRLFEQVWLRMDDLIEASKVPSIASAPDRS